MPLTIEFDDWLPAHHHDVREPVPRFRVRDGATPDFLVAFLLSGTLEAILQAQLSADEFAELNRGILRFGARVIEQRVRDGIWPLPDRTAVQMERIQEHDLELIVALIRDKDCDYRVAEGGDLFCAAAARADETVVGAIGIRRVAPTSKPICKRCALPDPDWRCTYLTHPEVWGTATIGGYSRDLLAAMCQLSQPEISNPGDCRPGGNRCWRREVGPEELETAPLPADAIALALDHLDASWRIAFGQPLVRLTSADSMAGIAQDCSSRAEFESRVSDVADVLKGLDIPDELLGDEATPKDQSLRRLRSVLVREAPDEEASVSAAIDYLATINRVRVAMQHGKAAPELPAAIERLGVAYPVHDWRQAWDVVRTGAARSLEKLARVIRSRL